MIVGPYVKSMFSLYEIAKLSSKVAEPFCIPISNEGEFLLLYSLPVFVVRVPDFDV